MPILFSAVACDKVLVSKFAACDGNFREIIAEVLSKIPPKNEKMTYSHGPYLFHYIIADNYFYFCITDKVSYLLLLLFLLNYLVPTKTTSKKVIFLNNTRHKFFF